MAMLAEQRRRQKFSTDPRGLNWSSDDSKFGQKLMEKYGWSKGQGLGANEDGMTEHIKIKAKSDSTGVGCSKKHEDNWIAHQDDFNSLLASLNSHNSQDAPVSGGDKTESSDMVQVLSLEKKSKKSKRVHYGKFTRGKDLSRAGTEDMDCIFGRRKSKSAPDTPQDDSENNSETEEAMSSEEKTTEHGVMTISSGTSVQAYFAKKMAELQKARAAANGEVTAENQGFSAVTSTSSAEQDTPCNSMESVNWNPDTPQSMEQESEEHVQDIPEKTSKKKKKSKKRKLQAENENSEERSDNGTPEESTKEGIGQVNSDVPDKKKKKKSKKRKLADLENPESDQITAADMDEDQVISSSKALNSEDAEESSDKLNSSKKKKSKKRKQTENSETADNECDNIDTQKTLPLEENSICDSTCDNDSLNVKKVKLGQPDASVPVIKYQYGQVKPSKKDIEVGFKGSNIGSIKGYGDGIQLRDTNKVAKKKKKSKSKPKKRK